MWDRPALEVVPPIFFTRRQPRETAGVSIDVWTLGQGKSKSKAACGDASGTSVTLAAHRFSEHLRVSTLF